jgi:hypothetical protein
MTKVVAPSAAVLQVAVHNVPFKWCNVDLEDLFREQEGYLDAQLLFHENGRSKVGCEAACMLTVCLPPWHIFWHA